jgi:hypothetical protein
MRLHFLMKPLYKASLAPLCLFLFTPKSREEDNPLASRWQILRPVRPPGRRHSTFPAPEVVGSGLEMHITPVDVNFYIYLPKSLNEIGSPTA